MLKWTTYDGDNHAELDSLPSPLCIDSGGCRSLGYWNDGHWWVRGVAHVPNIGDMALPIPTPEQCEAITTAIAQRDRLVETVKKAITFLQDPMGLYRDGEQIANELQQTLASIERESSGEQGEAAK